MQVGLYNMTDKLYACRYCHRRGWGCHRHELVRPFRLLPLSQRPGQGSEAPPRCVEGEVLAEAAGNEMGPPSSLPCVVHFVTILLPLVTVLLGRMLP